MPVVDADGIATRYEMVGTGPALLMFSPGGFEELFVKYRTDNGPAPGDGFVADALRLFATVFEP